MNWLYDERIVATFFLALLAATPAAAVVGAAIHRAVSERLSRRALALWIVVAVAGPLNYGLWHLFNVIEDRWGLDRVEPLLVNFAIFVSLGLIIGLLLRRFLRLAASDAESPSQPPENQ